MWLCRIMMIRHFTVQSPNRTKDNQGCIVYKESLVRSIRHSNCNRNPSPCSQVQCHKNHTGKSGPCPLSSTMSFRAFESETVSRKMETIRWCIQSTLSGLFYHLGDAPIIRVVSVETNCCLFKAAGITSLALTWKVMIIYKQDVIYDNAEQENACHTPDYTSSRCLRIADQR